MTDKVNQTIWVFDIETNFMRGKMKDGNFQSPFRADAWGGAFTEGSSWHYTWSVLHDPKGLMNLMGGRKEFIDKLDAVFETEPTSDFSYYGFKIHEIIEMELLNMGQYAHGNQPIQHAIYFYNYAREPWKTQQKIRYVLDNLYGPGPDGYCGDEDNGQTSAWYVFSSLGFYPVAPVTGQYVIGSPLFDKVELILSNGKKLEINSENNSQSNFYIGELSLNGLEYNKNWISHSDLVQGAKINFKMQNNPSDWGSDEFSVPYSMSDDK